MTGNPGAKADLELDELGLYWKAEARCASAFLLWALGWRFADDWLGKSRLRYLRRRAVNIRKSAISPARAWSASGVGLE